MDNLGNTTLNNLTFDGTAGAFTLSGLAGAETLLFQSSSAIVLPTLTQNSGAAQTVNLNLQLINSLTLGGTGAGSLTLNGIVSGTGNLTKATAGTLFLNGANTYSGGTTLAAGTTSVGNDAAFGTVVVNTTARCLSTTARRTATST